MAKRKVETVEAEQAVELHVIITFDGHNVKNMWCKGKNVFIKDGQILEKRVPQSVAVER
jgi:hypothetical protein